MVVDDDPDIRDTLADVLEQQGFEVRVVANGHDALQLLRQDYRPSVILLDLMMPVMDGWLFRSLQRTDPDLANIPVVVISAAPSWYSPIDVHHYVAKPLDFDRLVEKLRAVALAV